MIAIHPHPSINFDERPAGAVIKYVIVHYTEGNLEDSLKWLTTINPHGHPVSAHYLICPLGHIYGLVDEQKRAWHAGVSQWKEDHNLNATSIGIELVNDGVSAYTEDQIQALVELLQDIQNRLGILPENILGHEDVAPTRKKDPGEHFPWQHLADLGLAVYPREMAV